MNKYKIMKIPQRELIDIITGNKRIINIPEGTKLLSVRYNTFWQAIELLIENEIYPSVPDDAMIYTILAQVE